FYSSYCDHHDLYSFPTRRSSDLAYNDYLKLKYSFALLYEISCMILPIHGMSFGNSPCWISWPNKLHKTLLKYSCLGKDKKLLESVSIPIKQLISPMFDNAFICL